MILRKGMLSVLLVPNEAAMLHINATMYENENYILLFLPPL